MAVNVKKNILRLHVSVDDVRVMHVFQPEKNFAEIEFGCLLVELRVHVDVEEQFTARADVDEEIVEVLGFERRIGFADERVVDYLYSETFFNLYSFIVFLILDQILPNCFQPVQFPCLYQPYFKHL